VHWWQHRRFVVIGVWGANFYTSGALFVTRDQDLFVPRDAANLLRAWQCCDSLGLELRANEQPLDQPRDLDLANAVVARAALTTATDGRQLSLDLTQVMAGHDFDSVWARRRSFRIEGNAVPVASLIDIVDSKRTADRPKDRLFLATHAEQLRRLLGGSSGTP
jgi:hypothetical protein